MKRPHCGGKHAKVESRLSHFASNYMSRWQVHEEVLRLLLAAAPQMETATLARHLQTAIQNSRRSRKYATSATYAAIYFAFASGFCYVLMQLGAAKTTRFAQMKHTRTTNASSPQPRTMLLLRIH